MQEPIALLGDPRLPRRFWDHVTVTPEGCWAWTGHGTKGGYGLFTVTGETATTAHRASYRVLAGAIPAGMELDHLCHTADKSCEGGDNCPHRRCVNPAHVEVVSSSENSIRSRGCHKTHCIHGHELTEANTKVEATGFRKCRKCVNDRQRVAARARRSALKECA